MAQLDVGVVGTGAMGLGVVQSLVRAGFAAHARDIHKEAEAAARRAGAHIHPSPAALASACDVVILLVVDATQIDTVLFAGDGVAQVLATDAIVIVSSTVAPEYVASLPSRLDRGRLLDAPVSGGPQRAADGTMTLIVSGDARAVAACDGVFTAISGRRFVVGPHPGQAAMYKILNNQLAAANLAAGTEAMTLAIRAGLDPRQFLAVVNASSGASWIVADRMGRALDGDYAPRAAVKILAKDIDIAVETAWRSVDNVPLARAARDTFRAAVAAGLGGEDDAALLKLCCRRAGVKWPGEGA